MYWWSEERWKGRVVAEDEKQVSLLVWAGSAAEGRQARISRMVLKARRWVQRVVR